MWGLKDMGSLLLIGQSSTTPRMNNAFSPRTDTIIHEGRSFSSATLTLLLFDSYSVCGWAPIIARSNQATCFLFTDSLLYNPIWLRSLTWETSLQNPHSFKVSLSYMLGALKIKKHIFSWYNSISAACWIKKGKRAQCTRNPSEIATFRLIRRIMKGIQDTFSVH